MLAVLAARGGSDDPPTGTNNCGAVTGPTFHALEAQDEQVTTNSTWSKCGNPHADATR